MVTVQLRSTGAASRLPALLLGHILPVSSLVAPCRTGAASITTGLGATLDCHHGCRLATVVMWGTADLNIAGRVGIVRRMASGSPERVSLGLSHVRRGAARAVSGCGAGSVRGGVR